jgi:hypothetical protein
MSSWTTFDGLPPTALAAGLSPGSLDVPRTRVSDLDAEESLGVATTSIIALTVKGCLLAASHSRSSCKQRLERRLYRYFRIEDELSSGQPSAILRPRKYPPERSTAMSSSRSSPTAWAALVAQPNEVVLDRQLGFHVHAGLHALQTTEGRVRFCEPDSKI